MSMAGWIPGDWVMVQPAENGPGVLAMVVGSDPANRIVAVRRGGTGAAEWVPEGFVRAAEAPETVERR